MSARKPYKGPPATVALETREKVVASSAASVAAASLGDPPGAAGSVTQHAPRQQHSPSQNGRGQISQEGGSAPAARVDPTGGSGEDRARAGGGRNKDLFKVGGATTELSDKCGDSSSSSSSSSGLMGLAEESLARLYDTHDNFFSSDRDEKERRMKRQAKEVMEALARAEEKGGACRGGGGGGSSMHERARLSYIRGRALDVFSDFDPEAERCLARAVKLRPSDPDGWVALGHCFWKKQDLFAARRCFLTSLDKARKPAALRQLSMLLRQLPSTAAEETAPEDNLQESLRLAKEAVTIDVGCADSWYVLGNAYVGSFFRSSRGIKDLDRALQAYKKAESNGGGGNPDLFFNRAHVLHYREDYPEAIRDYLFARRLDPLLPVEPALHSIAAGVDGLAKLVERKGGLKAKRLSQLVAPLRGDSARRGLNVAAYRLVGLKDLRLGKNSGVAVALKVVMPAGQSAQPPERFVVVDRTGEGAVLSIYSISKEACEKIRSKDTLVVQDPSFRTICLGAPPPPPPTAPVAAAAACGGGVATAAAAAADADAVPLPAAASYPGIQADPSDVLLNGETMKAGFAPPSVRMTTFDK